jgi:hypothetical protein
MLQLVKPQRANDTELEITRLERVRGELADIAIERNLSGEAKQSFSSTIDWLTFFINEYKWRDIGLGDETNLRKHTERN